ncbi:Dyp-type peroxidase [Streptomyces niger]|uniref:Dyp-type peroxidase n=1 Tax=Streptomyces niger TaxID=66373 RepID=UPI00069A48D1|nr:Dyp-type peroxidase [Streptomyces niger]
MAERTDPSAPQALELADIQGAMLRKRPGPYVGSYLLLRIDTPSDGRRLLAHLLPHVASAARWWDPPGGAWLGVALSHSGLRALGVRQESLDSFPAEFIAGMADRAARLGDTGESSPEHWDAPLGSPDVHLVVAAFAADRAACDSLVETVREALRGLPDVQLLHRLEAAQLPSGRTHLGFVDNIGKPNIEGTGAPRDDRAGAAGPGHYGDPPGAGPAVKAGEFVLGYPDQDGVLATQPLPDALRRNGTYVAFRKLHVRVAEFRRYLKENASSAAEEELLAAKMVGRWRSGAPLVLAPSQDDPVLAADAARNNDFSYREQDPEGRRCPVGSHIRRMNPRDSPGVSVDVLRHCILRRSTTYGPELPEGQLTDDGAARGIVFLFMGTDIRRQFEFVKRQWANDGNFAGLETEQDPLTGNREGARTFTVPLPARARRHQYEQLPRFVVTKGGEYLFLPGIRALHWIAGLDH